MEKNTFFLLYLHYYFKLKLFGINQYKLERVTQLVFDEF